jgi:hypothetical protein
MRASKLAELMRAHRVGTNRWQARCPAHADSSPSLSIREGRDGRVLLHCFAGCDTKVILGTLKLKAADLFAGPPPSRTQLALMKSQRDAQEAADRLRRRWLLEASDEERRWGRIGDKLMKLLLRTNAESTAAAYHFALEKEREWEAEGCRRAAE